MVICLQRGANDFHTFQLMPLLTITSCQLTQVVLKKANKRVLLLLLNLDMLMHSTVQYQAT